MASTQKDTRPLIQEINEVSDFKAAISQPGIVVLDFYSPVCPPCEVSLFFLSPYQNTQQNHI